MLGKVWLERLSGTLIKAPDLEYNLAGITLPLINLSLRIQQYDCIVRFAIGKIMNYEIRLGKRISSAHNKLQCSAKLKRRKTFYRYQSIVASHNVTQFFIIFLITLL